MKTKLLQKDIQVKQHHIRNLESVISYFQQDSVKYKRDIELAEGELFYLQDQLSYYNTVIKIIQEEEGVEGQDLYDEVPKEIVILDYRRKTK